MFICTRHSLHEMLDDVLHTRDGDVVVFTGRNRGKIDRMLPVISAGLHVLADKPWIISSGDMPKLEQAFAVAESKHVVAYDIMTERYEVTSELQRELVNVHEIFGEPVKGDAQHPGVVAKSVHHVMKVVAGVPLRRPVWFFDIVEYGEGLADVGTHVVDLVQWTLLPDTPFDYRQDIEALEGRRWPLDHDFRAVSRLRDRRTRRRQSRLLLQQLGPLHPARYPREDGHHLELGSACRFRRRLRSGIPRYSCQRRNPSGRRREIHPGSLYRPSCRCAEPPSLRPCRRRVDQLQARWPGLAIEQNGTEARLVAFHRDKFRVGHEAHFAQVARRFFDYAKDPKSLPAWERSYMLAKYYVSTRGVELAQPNQ